jgi:hypothetical protein
MKTVVLCGITLLTAAQAFAQTIAPASADPASKTVTLTGCVGGGSASAPITLSQAIVVPATSQPGSIESPSPVPPSVSSLVTQPADPILPPSGAAPVTPSPIGTSGTKTSSVTVAGTTGVVTGTAPAGSSGSSITGYRLSGADMQPWIGKRVQLVGTFVPAAASTAGTTTPGTVTSGTSAPPVLEFRVQSVQPVTGSCQKP